MGPNGGLKYEGHNLYDPDLSLQCEHGQHDACEKMYLVQDGDESYRVICRCICHPPPKAFGSSPSALDLPHPDDEWGGTYGSG
jgi:hypothetical protein